MTTTLSFRALSPCHSERSEESQSASRPGGAVADAKPRARIYDNGERMRRMDTDRGGGEPRFRSVSFCPHPCFPSSLMRARPGIEIGTWTEISRCARNDKQGAALALHDRSDTTQKQQMDGSHSGGSASICRSIRVHPRSRRTKELVTELPRFARNVGDVPAPTRRPRAPSP